MAKNRKIGSLPNTKNVFFRFENVFKTKVLDTQNCIAIGFLNTGVAPALLNRTLPIPFQNPNNSYNVVWFPLTDGERDATRYEIFFDRPGQLVKRVLVIYKQPYG